MNLKVIESILELYLVFGFAQPGGSMFMPDFFLDNYQNNLSLPKQTLL